MKNVGIFMRGLVLDSCSSSFQFHLFRRRQQATASVVRDAVRRRSEKGVVINRSLRSSLAEARRACEALRGMAGTSGADERVALRLQETTLTVPADLWRLWLQPGVPEQGVVVRQPIDPKAPVRWTELDKLRSLCELEYNGTDPRVVAYVAKRKGLKTFRWLSHERRRIDLSRTAITEASVHVNGELALRVPRTLTRLSLLSARQLSKLSVETDDEGARLSLYVWGPRGRVPAVTGLAALRTLVIGATASLDLRPLVGYRALRDLDIYGDDSGIEVTGIATLARWPTLESVSLRNMYHTSFLALPPPAKLPSLARLTIDGIRAHDAAAVKRLYAGFRGLSMRGVRTDAWLRANADNPFREWKEEHGAALGRRATKAYRAAHAAIDARRPNAKQALAILRAFIDAFNAVEADIDTIMREEIDGAYGTVAARLAHAVPEKQAIAWFDAWREF
jgi:hypothetical protein